MGFLFIFLSLNLISAIEVHLISPRLSNAEVYPEATNFCDVDWECTQWGKCIDGVKRRKCLDYNNCQYKYNTPITKMSCREKTGAKEAPNSENQLFVFGFIIVILLIIILIIILGLL